MTERLQEAIELVLDNYYAGAFLEETWRLDALMQELEEAYDEETED